jgi:hypothetical protein
MKRSMNLLIFCQVFGFKKLSFIASKPNNYYSKLEELMVSDEVQNVNYDEI